MKSGGVIFMISIKDLVKAAGEEYPHKSERWLILYLENLSSVFSFATI